MNGAEICEATEIVAISRNPHGTCHGMISPKNTQTMVNHRLNRVLRKRVDWSPPSQNRKNCCKNARKAVIRGAPSVKYMLAGIDAGWHLQHVEHLAG